MSELKSIDTTALQGLISALGDASKLVSDLLSGFNLSEIGEGIAVFRDLKAVLDNKDQLVSEFSSLQDDDRAFLASLVDNVKFPSDAGVETIIQKVLKVSIYSSTFLQLLGVMGLPLKEGEKEGPLMTGWLQTLLEVLIKIVPDIIPFLLKTKEVTK